MLLAIESAAHVAPKKVAELASHLTRLTPDGEWAAWRWVCLRAAGFPATEVLRLSSLAGAAAADRVIEAGESEKHARKGLLSVLDSELGVAAPERFDSLRNEFRDIRQALKKNKLTGHLSVDPVVQEAIEIWKRSYANVESAQHNFMQIYESEVERISGEIREVAAGDRFREAVLWQSRHAFHTGLESLLKPDADGSYKRNSRRRQHEELIGSYLQRYCAKNDSVGFFGPIGWARFKDHGPMIAAKPGKDLLATRTVYFESWAIDALVEALIESDSRIRRWAAPKLLPVVCLEGNFLKLPLAKPINLSNAQQALVRACDGKSTAAEIARRLASEFPSELPSEVAVYRMLDYLRLKEVITWTFEIPFSPWPERSLRSLLNRIDDPQMRAAALAKLDTLEQARDKVTQSTGDWSKLDSALANLQSTFTEVTRRASNRAAGKMYAGRTLVYEDCRRDIDVELGPAMIEALGAPLELLLASARWLTVELALQARKSGNRIYSDLARQTTDGKVESAAFWARIQTELATSDPSSSVRANFSDRWMTVLDLPENESQVKRTSEQLRERVGEMFSAAVPGWRAAKYHSPDVMMVASSVEAVREGDFEFVMGELHAGINTLSVSLFMEQHPSKQDLFQAAAIDIPEPRVVVSPHRYGGVSGRNHTALVLPKDFRLEFSVNSDKVPVGRPIPVADLVVEKRNGELMVSTRDGRHSFELVEVLADLLSSQALQSFRLLKPANHSPRVTIDRLIVARESWVFAARDMTFAYEKSNATRFVEARRWAHAAKMPRFVFMKSPVEVKPVYVDFDSPLFVDLFSRIIRRTRDSNGDAETIAISEMIPRLDQTWLSDSVGNHYTSEFRIVAVDQQSV